MPRHVALALAALVAAGLIWLSRHAPPFREVSDGAILEIYTLQALKGRLLVGPYSRFGWHHPGPLYFYLEAPWYLLSGCHTAGMQAGALSVNLVATAAIAWAALRSASAPTVLALCGGVVWYLWRTGDMIVSPWNPHVIVLPLVAFIVLTAAFTAGRPGLLPWLVVVGSFLAQTHIAMVPVVGVLMMVAAAARREQVRAHWRAAGALAFALWLPPIIEQLARRPGNMTRIVTFFFTGPSAGQPIMTAVAAWSASLTGAFSRDFVVAMGFDVRRTDAVWPLAWSAALMVLLLVSARRARARHDPFTLWLAVMCAVTAAIALVATTRIREQIVDHEVFWISALGVIGAAAIAGSVGWPRGNVPIAPAAFILIIAAALTGLGGMRHVLQRARTTDDHSVDVLAASIERYTSGSQVRRPLIHIDQQIWPIAAGALLLLHKNGVSLAVDDRWITMFGEAFEPDGREDAEVTITGSPRQPRIATLP